MKSKFLYSQYKVLNDAYCQNFLEKLSFTQLYFMAHRGATVRSAILYIYFPLLIYPPPLIPFFLSQMPFCPFHHIFFIPSLREEGGRGVWQVKILLLEVKDKNSCGTDMFNLFFLFKLGLYQAKKKRALLLFSSIQN